MLSVIIPTCNRPELLAECLKGIESGTDPKIAFEVVVTDDGTTSVEGPVKASFPWVKWCAGPRLGPAANRNNGAKQSQFPVLVFLDDDCIPHSGWLSAYQTASRDGSSQVWEGATVPIGKRSRVDMECPVNLTGGFLWSCNFAIRRDTYEAIGGFDEAFPFAAMEDADLRTRLARYSATPKFVPDAVVGHPWRVKPGRRGMWKMAVSLALFLHKHPDQRSGFMIQKRPSGLLRYLLKHLPSTIKETGPSGVIRDIALHLYAEFLIFKYCGTRKRIDKTAESIAQRIQN